MSSTESMMPEGWVFNAIWKHHADSRAKVCIPDTVLIKDGAPYRWLFTSRAGEVVRKRALDLVAVRDRFAKIALVHRNNEQRLVATLRERGSSAADPTQDPPKHLEPEDFSTFLQERLTASGNRVVALQAFVPSRGEAGTAYINSYEAPASKKGRPVTTTHRVRHWRSGGKHTEGKRGSIEGKSSVDAASSVGGGGQIMAPVRVRDQRLCSDLDATTRAVVDYLQRQHRLRIINMKCEYVVDDESRVWFTWAWNVHVEKNTRKRRGGEGYGNEGESELDQGDSLVEISQGSKLSASADGTSGVIRGRRRQRERFAAGSKDARQAEKMLNAAVDRVESVGIGGSGLAGSLGSSFGGEGTSKVQAGGGSTFGIVRGGATSPRGNPGPTFCHGDYCDFRVRDPAVLAMESKHRDDNDAMHDFRRRKGVGGRDLFTPSEMELLASRLGSTSAVDNMLNGEEGLSSKGIGPPKAEHTILFKSVALARKEKRGVAAMDKIAAGTSEIMNPEEYIEGKHNHESVMTKTTDASRMKVQRVKARQLGMDGGAANYYKSVRVCTTCYRVYSTLDAARELLQFQQEESAAALRSSQVRRLRGGSSVLTEGK